MRKLHRRDWMELPQNRFLRGVYLLIQRFLRHNVGMQGAALAFYLLFMIFPLLIFVSALLGLLHLDVNGILEAAGEFLPRQVVSFIGVYLTYVAANPSMKLLLFGLFFSLYFPMRATNALMRSVRIAYHLGPPRGAFVQLIKTLVYTAVLIAAIALTLTLMTVGDRVLLYAVEHFGLPYFWASLWARLRFPVAGAAGYFALFFLYAIWPGTLTALAVWLALNWLYATYVENFADYSLLYGSIGTAIALLIWLYMSAVTLIMGAEFNATLISLRKDRAGDS